MAKASAFRARVEVNGAVQSADMIRRIGARARNTWPVTTKAVEVLQRQQAARVESKPWMGLAEETIARKARESELTEVFRDEQRLIHGQPTRVADAAYSVVVGAIGYPGQLAKATRTTATFGLQSKGKQFFWYMRLAQNAKGNKRRYLAINENDALELTDVVATYLVWGE